MDEGAEEDPGGRTAAETGPAKSSAHVQWRLRLLQEIDANYFAQPICLYLTRHARISWEILMISQSVVHLRSYPHYLEFPDDWFAVPREGHDSRPRPLYIEISQEW